MKINNKISKTEYKYIILLITVATLILRLFFVFRFPYFVEQHDVVGKNRFAQYFYTIFQTGQLPNSNVDEFYHPPLSMIVFAAWIKVITLFVKNINVAINSTMLISVVTSIFTLFFIYKILNLLRLNKLQKIIIYFGIAFYPFSILSSRWINNDVLSYFFMTLTMYYLIKWHRKINYKNTIGLAVAFSCGLMTKFSAVILSIPITYVFLLEFVRIIKKNKGDFKFAFKRLLPVFAVFLIISIPLGLWFYIRNYILFGQNINYVLDPNMQRIENNNIWRFVIPSFKEIFAVYVSKYDTNIIAGILKTSLYDERVVVNNLYILEVITELCNGLFFMALFISILCQVFTIKNSKKNIVERISMLLLIIVNLCGYVSVNLKLPYFCTMNFRYIVAFLPIGILFLVTSISRIENIKIKRTLEIMLGIIYLIISMAISIFTF